VASRARRQPRWGGAAALGLVLGWAAVLPGRAAAEAITPQALLQQSTLVINQQSNVYTFTAPGPGTLSVQLEDILWPTPLQSLSASIDSPGNVLGSLSAGTLNLTISQAGTYYADVTSQAGGPLDLGLYSMQVEFYPQGTPVPMPLPAALVLLCGGLGVLGGLRLWWRRNESFMYGA
jgi:hypothetical protein